MNTAVTPEVLGESNGPIESDRIESELSRDQFRYHKSGHQFYKSKYLRSKETVSKLTQLVIALIIVLGAVAYYAVGTAAENRDLEAEVISLKQQVYESL